MRKCVCLLAAVTASLLFAPASVEASLIGDTVNVFRGTDLVTRYNQNKVVGPGVEIDDDAPQLFTMDIRAKSLFFESKFAGNWRFGPAPGAAWFEWRFTDLDLTDGPIVGLTLVDNTTPGMDFSRFSFTGDSVTINIRDTPPWFQLGDSFEIFLETNNATIPEPGSLVVWGVVGLASVGLSNRRRR